MTICYWTKPKFIKDKNRRDVYWVSNWYIEQNIGKFVNSYKILTRNNETQLALLLEERR